MAPSRDQAVERFGTRGGPLVVLLHGAVANRQSWLPVVRRLPEFESVTFDLPGHGERRDEPFALREALDSIARVFVSLQPRTAVLAGDSLGGYLALAAAAEMKAGVAGVVAGGCTWEMTGLGGALARATDLPMRALSAVAGEKRLERAFARLLGHLTDRETARAIVAGGLRVAARSESLRALRGLELRPLVADVRVPVAFVNGARDWPTRAGEARLVRAARYGSLHVAAGVGHGVGLLAPQLFADTIRAVVARADALSQERSAIG